MEPTTHWTPMTPSVRLWKLQVNWVAQMVPRIPGRTSQGSRSFPLICSQPCASAMSQGSPRVKSLKTRGLTQGPPEVASSMTRQVRTEKSSIPMSIDGSVLGEGEVPLKKKPPPLAPSQDGDNRDEDLPPLKNFQQGDSLYLDLRSGE